MWLKGSAAKKYNSSQQIYPFTAVWYQTWHKTWYKVWCRGNSIIWHNWWYRKRSFINSALIFNNATVIHGSLRSNLKNARLELPSKRANMSLLFIDNSMSNSTQLYLLMLKKQAYRLFNQYGYTMTQRKHCLYGCNV